MVYNDEANLTTLYNIVAVSERGNRGIESCIDTIGGPARLARILLCRHSRFPAKRATEDTTDGPHVEAIWIGG